MSTTSCPRTRELVLLPTEPDGATPWTVPESPTPSPRPAPTATEPWLIAALTANGRGAHAYLQLEEEIRDIEQGLQGARHREFYRLLPVLAVTFGRILRALDDHEPAIVHVSGHATPSGALVLKNPDGTTHHLPPARFAELLSLLSMPPWLATFCTCHSASLARAASRICRYAIGFEGPLADDTALVFSATLIERLAARPDPDVPRAFRLACLACRAAGHHDIERAHLFEHPGRKVSGG